MKKILSILFAVLTIASVSLAQTTCNSGLPPQSGEGYWGGVPIEDVISNVQLIFEGRVLSDSAFLANPPGRVCTAHRILVLKEFKGNFISDTIEAFNYGGTVLWQGAPTGEMSYVKIGDEDIFMVSTATNHTYFNLDKPDFYFMMYGRDCGYVNVCNKKEDEVQEMYAKLERHIGHKHTEVHPRVCAGPEDQKKSPVLKTGRLRNDDRRNSTIFYSLENATISGPSVNFSIYSYVIDSLITLYSCSRVRIENCMSYFFTYTLNKIHI